MKNCIRRSPVPFPGWILPALTVLTILCPGPLGLPYLACADSNPVTHPPTRPGKTGPGSIPKSSGLAASQGLSPAIQTIVEAHCAECHDSDTRKGGVQLENTALNRDTFELWVRAFDAVQSGEMPPAKKGVLPPGIRAEFLKHLRDNLGAHETRQATLSGRSQLRRLNRVEYESVLRDLLALPLLRVKEMLPEDGQQFGIDKAAGALDISPVQMAKYLQTAEYALRQAVVHDQSRPETKVWRGKAVDQSTVRGAIQIHCAVPLKGNTLAEGLSTHIVGNPEKDPGNCYRGAQFKGEADSVAVLTGVIGAHQPEGIQPDGFRAGVAGHYRVRFSTWALRWNRTQVQPSKAGTVRHYNSYEKPFFQDENNRWQGTPVDPEKALKPVRERVENLEFFGEQEAAQVVRASLKGVPLGYFDAPSLRPTVHEFTVWLNPGEKVSFHAMTLPASGAFNHSVSQGVRDYEGPAVAYDWFEFEGPLVETWPPESQRRLFGNAPVKDSTRSAADRLTLLRAFAERAFRRPVDESEVSAYARIIDACLARGDSPAEAQLSGYKAVLCAPDFLLTGLEGGVPVAQQQTLAPLGDYALASRLSLFLWNSLPDEPLLELARQKKLGQPDTLRAQVRRMLTDPRSERFVEHFLDEWLELKKIDFTTPDPNLYPDYDPWLKDSMMLEARTFFRKMIADNLGVRHLVASDRIFINQRLAQLYGLGGVFGADIREVKVEPGVPRGGFLTQAAVLKVTANGTATSPVLRGVWVSERILGIPRRQPPPNIPAVEPDATGAVTIRQMIEKHREDASCAGCHARIDPPGMALESFDVLGGYRDQYRISGVPKKVRKGKELVEDDYVEVVSDAALRNRFKVRLGSQVDSSGRLHDGRSFAGINELRALLAKDEPVLAANLVRQLLVYATGAGIRFSDRTPVDAIVAAARPGGYGMRSLVEEVAVSELFRSK